MKVLVTGASGLLGYHICSRFQELGHEVVGMSRLDPVHEHSYEYCLGNLLLKDDVIHILAQERPDVVINCVAYVSVDGCELFPGKAWNANAESVRYLAQLTRDMNIKLMHISTDHVFNGETGGYDKHAIPNPVNVYGWSKRGGEKICHHENPNSLVVRTNFYGWAPPCHEPTFADWMYESLRDQKPLKLYTDYYFNALEVNYLVECLNRYLCWEGINSIIHVGSKDRVSKFEFGMAMAKVFGFSAECITPTTFAKTPMKVPRPKDLSLKLDPFVVEYSTEQGLQRLKDTMKVSK